MFVPAEKIWRAPTTQYPYGNQSFAEVAYKAMLTDLQHVCQISDDSGEVYTDERMLKAAVSVANGLTKLGIKKGDIILALMHNHHYLLPTWFGCLLVGVILCPFHTDNAVKDDLHGLIEKIQPKMMFTTHLDLVETFQSVFKQVNIECPIYTYENQIQGCHDMKPLLENHFTSFEEFTPASVDDINETLVLILSSATTGKAKLIKCTHKQMLMQFPEAFQNLRFITTALPGWQSEFVFMTGALTHKICRIIRVHYTIEQVLLMLEKYEVGATFIKPKDIFEMLRSETIKKVDLSKLVVVLTSGHHLSVKIAKDLQKYLPNGVIISMYGVSELGGGTTEASNLDPSTPNLVGKIKRNYEYIVLDEAGNRLGPNEVGEICYTSPAPFAGYYKDEEKTKECITKDGFFSSGDLGHIDENGNIFLRDRKKFEISYRGKALSQWDVEKIILENVEGINAVCCVDAESEKHGVMIYIAIIPKPGTVLVEADIIKTVMKHHPFEFETRVFFFETLPMTISGKYKKFIIRDMVLKKLAEE